MVRDEDEVLNEYWDPKHDPFTDLVVLVLEQMPLDELQAMSGMGKSALIEIRQRRSVPHHGNRDRLERVAADWVRAQDPSRATVDDHLSVLAAVVNAAAVPSLRVRTSPDSEPQVSRQCAAGSRR